MTKKRAQDTIAQACEAAMVETYEGRWTSAESLLREATHTAAGMTGRKRVALAKLTPVRNPDARYSQSLERGLTLLSLFTPRRPILGIADMADDLGWARSTTHRYALTLVALGQLEQAADRRYRLAAQ